MKSDYSYGKNYIFYNKIQKISIFYYSLSGFFTIFFFHITDKIKTKLTKEALTMKFNPENPIFIFLDTLTDFIFLNLVFLLTCLPVITIGPALCALSSVTMQEARKEHSRMIFSYLKAMKQNFVSSSFLFFFYIITGAILLFNFAFWLSFSGIIGTLAVIVVTFCTFLYLFSICYSFALNARFKNTWYATLRNSLIIAFQHLKYTLLFTAVAIIMGILGVYVGSVRIFLLSFGFAFLSYCQSFALIRIFETYENQTKTVSANII